MLQSRLLKSLIRKSTSILEYIVTFVNRLMKSCTRTIILAVKKADHLNITTKWLANTVREYSVASQSERVPQSCFYVKVAMACLSYCEYSIISKFENTYS